MKVRKTFFSLALLVYSCQQSTPPADKVLQSPEPQLNHPFSVVDSLVKYAATDSLYDFDSLLLYVGKVNKRDFGLLGSNDSTTILYQPNPEKWIATDTIAYPLSGAGFGHIEIIDVNGDRLKDLIITYYITGAGGNSENFCLLYDPFKKRFIHNSYFDLPNIFYDKIHKQVCSAWWASANHSQEKVCYKITGDSLTLQQGVRYEPDEESAGEIGTVIFYQIVGNQHVENRRVSGKQENMWPIFTKAIWYTGNR